MNLMENKSATELRTLLINGGVWAYADDFRFAAENDLVAYIGYSDKVHRYAIPIKDGGKYAIRTMIVWLGPVGRMVGEMEPDVIAEVETPIEAINYIIHARRRS
jgi:hypothetical protein